MNTFAKHLLEEDNYTTTENGAGALRSTMNACLDAFGSLGAMRFTDDDTIIRTFSKAFAEDPKLAMRMLFYMRDIRGGQGARRVFRVIIKWLADYKPDYVIYNLDNFLTFGRGDDIICLLDTGVKNRVINWAFQTLRKDWASYRAGEPCSLLAKWMPSENTSSPATRAAAREFIRGFGWKPAHYRKMLSALRKYLKVVEQSLSAKDWTNIKYDAVPAAAALKYTDTFLRHDEEGYLGYLRDVANGNAKVNAASLFPVNIIHKALESNRASIKDRILLDAMWNALPNYCEGHEETGICVVDVSGSMYGTPIEVALSLGLYCADKCRGPFKDCFITFSSRPTLQTCIGGDIVEKVRNMYNAHWEMNTNLEAVFNLLLETAKAHHTPQEDMPSKLYIISDMQFDEARSDGDFWERRKPRTFMQAMEQKYAAAGYKMPIIVYWNVRASDMGMFQTTFEGKQCCMVSGYSPSLFKSIIEGTTYEEVTKVDKDGNVIKTLEERVDPIQVMLTTLNNERYDCVWVG